LYQKLWLRHRGIKLFNNTAVKCTRSRYLL
jgi:hypothetical protein